MADAPRDSFTKEDYVKFLIGLAVVAFLTAFVAFASSNGAKAPEAAGSNLPSVNIESGDTLEIAGAPGETVNFTIGVRIVTEGAWRSADGLHVTIAGKEYLVLAPRDEEWGNTLPFDSRGTGDRELDAQFVVPGDAKVGETLEGELGGSVTVAQYNQGGFENVAVRPQNPVKVRVVTNDESAALSAGRANALKREGDIELYVAIAAAVVLVLSVFGAWWIARK